MDSATKARGRVLLVEDEALTAIELADALSDAGWDVIGPLGTVGEGLQLLAGGERPDVAVLDVNLGGELVFVLADRLRTHGVPIIFCTGYQEADPEGRYPDCPVVHKPVDYAELDRAITGRLAA